MSSYTLTHSYLEPLGLAIETVCLIILFLLLALGKEVKCSAVLCILEITLQNRLRQL